MTLPQPDTGSDAPLGGTDTIVSYPRGGTENTGVVLHVHELPTGPDGARWAVLLDTTSCHPVDPGWPDQGADHAVLRFDGVILPVLDCVVAATDGATLYLGSDIPVRKGTAGWSFLVAHIVGDARGLAEGNKVEVRVDSEYRTALSLGHSGCHLASLALNRALSGRWSKEVRSDGLGQPDFDALAIESSRITERGATDVYRLNKSLRRKGFDSAGLEVGLQQLADEANATLAGWTASGGAIRIDADGPRLTDRRYWVCELPEATVSIPCGGTHAHSLAELGRVTVALELAEVDATPVLTMTTTVVPG